MGHGCVQGSDASEPPPAVSSASAAEGFRQRLAACDTEGELNRVAVGIRDAKEQGFLNEAALMSLRAMYMTKMSLIDANTHMSAENKPESRTAGVRSPRIERFMRFWRPVWHFVIEYKEQVDPHRYGKRLPYRRLFLAAGVACLGAFLARAIHTDLTVPVEDQVKELLAELGMTLDWPTGANGTTIFSRVFAAYGESRRVGDDVMITAWSFMATALVVEPVMRSKRGLVISKAFVALSMLALFCGMLLPALPDYLALTDIEDLCPKCGPQFTRFVDSTVRNLVGLACSALFSVNLLVALLAVCPALVRVSKMILKDTHLTNSIRASPGELYVYKRNVLLVFSWGSLLAPFLCCLSMLVFYQAFDDSFVAVCLLAFVLLPTGVAFRTGMHNLVRQYVLYMCMYFLPLVAILVWEAAHHDLSESLERILKDPYTYVELVAEISLANVIVSDVMYACFF